MEVFQEGKKKGGVDDTQQKIVIFILDLVVFGRVF